MDDEHYIFQSIVDKLVGEDDSIVLGKMMSSPGIKYRNKVFAFYYGKEMVFRLGKGFDPESYGVENYSLLSPFKSKPPMAGWFQVPFTESQKWEKLARHALGVISQESS